MCSATAMSSGSGRSHKTLLVVLDVYSKHYAAVCTMLHYAASLSHLYIPLSTFTPVAVNRYNLGKVLGAGSFGVVREAKEKSTDRHYACKTIPKVPKRGFCTPRYLLKLQTEVDVMQQLGASLDSVYLKVASSSKNYGHVTLYVMLSIIGMLHGGLTLCERTTGDAQVILQCLLDRVTHDGALLCTGRF